MSEQVAIVTGASQGLGEGIARAYRDRGWRVVGVSRTIAPADEPDWITVAGDVGDPATAEAAVAAALSRCGIRANAVSPGITETPMHPVETRAGLGRYHPLGRMGTVADIVHAVLYLEDATFVTGEILHVDGGQVAGH